MGLDFGRIFNIFDFSRREEIGFTPDGSPINLNRCGVAQNDSQTIGNNSTTVVEWNVIDFDDDSMFDSNTNTIITVRDDGDYLIESGLAFVNNGTGTRQLGVHLNGAGASIVQDNLTPNSGQNAILGCSRIVTLKAGDTIETRIRQSSGGDLNLNNQTSQNFMQVVKLGKQL